MGTTTTATGQITHGRTKTFTLSLAQVTLLEQALDYALAMSKEHDGMDLEPGDRRTLYRLAGRFEQARGDLAEPAVHDCTSCGTSMDDCDDGLVADGNACCSTCRHTDTHGDTPSRMTERLAARGIQR